MTNAQQRAVERIYKLNRERILSRQDENLELYGTSHFSNDEIALLTARLGNRSARTKQDHAIKSLEISENKRILRDNKLKHMKNRILNKHILVEQSRLEESNKQLIELNEAVFKRVGSPIHYIIAYSFFLMLGLIIVYHYIYLRNIPGSFSILVTGLCSMILGGIGFFEVVFSKK